MAHAHVDISGERTSLDNLAQKAIVAGVILAVFGIIASLMMHSLLGDSEAGHETTAAVEHATPAHGSADGQAAHHAIGHIQKWSPYHPYLVNVAFFLSITLGALFFVIIHHLTRAGWSASLRRLAEATSLNFVLLAVLLVPIALRPGALSLYKWMDPDPGDVLIGVKSGWWLFHSGFVGRLVIYLTVWIGLSALFYRLSTRQDKTGDPKLSRTMGRVTPIALLLFAVTLTAASFDLLMSLDAHWFSTIFGVYFFAGCVLSFHSFLALLTIWLQKNGRLERSVTEEHLQDVGKMMFAFTVFWAYIAFSQYMLYWYANIPEETGWFLRRQAIFTWGAWGFFLVFGHFVVPFLFLLSRHVKRRRATLAIGASWMLIVHWCDLYYLVMPQVNDGLVFPFSMLDVTIFIAMGGVYLASTAWILRRNKLLAVNDPKLPEALAFHNV